MSPSGRRLGGVRGSSEPAGAAGVWAAGEGDEEGRRERPSDPTDGTSHCCSLGTGLGRQQGVLRSKDGRSCWEEGFPVKSWAGGVRQGWGARDLVCRENAIGEAARQARGGSQARMWSHASILA